MNNAKGPWENCPTQGKSFTSEDGTCQEKGHSHIPEDRLQYRASSTPDTFRVIRTTGKKSR